MLPESYADLNVKGAFPFRPGMSAIADIQTTTHINVWSVPINAVTTREIKDSTKAEKKHVDDGDSDAKENVSPDELETVVFVIDEKDNTLKKVKVKTAIQDINYIEVTEGLKGNEMVVSGPYDVVSKELKEKDRVKVVKKEELYEKKE